MSNAVIIATLHPRSEQVANRYGFGPSTLWFVANRKYDAAAPRLIGQAINPAAVREVGGTDRSGLLDIVKRQYRGEAGVVQVIWPNGKVQNVRPYTAG